MLVLSLLPSTVIYYAFLSRQPVELTLVEGAMLYLQNNHLCLYQKVPWPSIRREEMGRRQMSTKKGQKKQLST